MSIVKLNNRSVKNITSFGSLTSGSMTFISKTTISSPTSSVQFTSGIDNTYKEYIFYFVNLHPNSNSEPDIRMNFSIDGGSNYNVTKTTTAFYARHAENGDFASMAYESDSDLSQSTANQAVGLNMESDNDGSLAGYLHLFNPSSTTFVKHYITHTISYHGGNLVLDEFSGGYGNTTSAVDAIRFQMSSGNIDAGTITLYGIN